MREASFKQESRTEGWSSLLTIWKSTSIANIGECAFINPGPISILGFTDRALSSDKGGGARKREQPPVMQRPGPAPTRATHLWHQEPLVATATA